MSNGVFNSSVVVRDNIQTWPLAPTPVMVNTLNTSFSVMVTLEVVHMDIISLFIQVCVCTVAYICRNVSVTTLSIIYTFICSFKSQYQRLKVTVYCWLINFLHQHCNAVDSLSHNIYCVPVTCTYSEKIILEAVVASLCTCMS